MTTKKDLKRETQIILSSLIISSTKGLTINNLRRDYREETGVDVPFIKLGFSTLEEFLRSIPETCRISGYGNYATVIPVVSENVKHINDMIMKQKTPRNNYSRGYRPPRLKGIYTGGRNNHGQHISYAKGDNCSNSKKSNISSYSNTNPSSNTNYHEATTGSVKVDDCSYGKNSNISSYSNTNSKSNTYSNSDTSYHEANTSNAKVEDSSYNKNSNISSYSNSISRSTTNSNSIKNYEPNTSNVKVDDCAYNANSNINSANNENINTNTNSSTSASYGEQNASYFKMDDCPYNENHNPNANTITNYNRNTSCDDNNTNYSVGCNIPYDSDLAVDEFVEENDILDDDFCYHSDTEDTIVVNKYNEATDKSPVPNRSVSTFSFSSSDTPQIFPKSRVNDSVKEKIQILISENPDGIWCSQLMKLYRQRWNEELEPTHYGFSSVIHLCDDMPDILKCIRPNRRDWKIFGKNASVPPFAETDFAEYLLTLPSLDVSTSAEPPIPEILVKPINYLYPDSVMKPGDIIPRQWLINNEQEEEYLELIVSEVYDPSKFWIQLKHNTTSVALSDLMDALQVFYGRILSHLRLCKFSARVGLFCSALFLNEYHRAVIIKIFDDETLKVYFIDYGTVGEVFLEKTYLLHKDFSQLPQQAIRARLANIIPKEQNTMWPRVASQLMLNLVRDKHLIGFVTAIDHTRHILHLILTDTTMPNIDIHVNDALIDKGYALIGNEAPMCETSTALLPNIHLYPAHYEIENGIYPSVTDVIRMMKLGQTYDIIFYGYFKKPSSGAEYSKYLETSISGYKNINHTMDSTAESFTLSSPELINLNESSHSSTNLLRLSSPKSQNEAHHIMESTTDLIGPSTYNHSVTKESQSIVESTTNLLPTNKSGQRFSNEDLFSLGSPPDRLENKSHIRENNIDLFGANSSKQPVRNESQQTIKIMTDTNGSSSLKLNFTNESQDSQKNTIDLLALSSPKQTDTNESYQLRNTLEKTSDFSVFSVERRTSTPVLKSDYNSCAKQEFPQEKCLNSSSVKEEFGSLQHGNISQPNTLSENETAPKALNCVITESSLNSTMVNNPSERIVANNTSPQRLAEQLGQNVRYVPPPPGFHNVKPIPNFMNFMLNPNQFQPGLPPVHYPYAANYYPPPGLPTFYNEAPFLPNTPVLNQQVLYPQPAFNYFNTNTSTEPPPFNAFNNSMGYGSNQGHTLPDNTKTTERDNTLHNVNNVYKDSVTSVIEELEHKCSIKTDTKDYLETEGSFSEEGTASDLYHEDSESITGDSVSKINIMKEKIIDDEISVYSSNKDIFERYVLQFKKRDISLHVIKFEENYFVSSQEIITNLFQSKLLFRKWLKETNLNLASFPSKIVDFQKYQYIYNQLISYSIPGCHSTGTLGCVVRITLLSDVLDIVNNHGDKNISNFLKTVMKIVESPAIWRHTDLTD